jgi:hypothetical protein
MPRDGGCGQAPRTGTGGEPRMEFGDTWLSTMKLLERGGRIHTPLHY